MPGSAIGIELNLGYPGSVSRSIDTIITPRPVKSVVTEGNETQPSILFGEPVILNTDNTYSRFGASGTAATFAGIAVREVKQATDYYAGCGSYLPGEIMDVIERGSVTVKCNAGTPTSGGKVYVRTAVNTSIPTGVVGQFEAEADGTNTVEITNARWKTGKKDSNNVAELTILTRVNP
ncbi:MULTISPECIES: hypothetical protein [unclassified Clostridium]|uniref:structural cement protein Gp24 n=1 Tax=unclassified Clostridium TaxID=2614128 RepID=UPI0002982B6E|nr:MULTISPECIES: hypothetical protein [unclassified Clostridium]EKQ56276.1 MAG: hypothetical protein A370_02032 [Clostridium sp. Maddingley MBC34-26]